MIRPSFFRFPAVPIVLGGMVIIISLFPAAPAWARSEPTVGIFGDVYVGPGDVVQEDVICIGADAVVEGRVEGDVVVIFGNLDFSGEAENVVSILSDSHFEEGSVIRDELVHVLGRMERDPTLEVGGQIVDFGSKLPPFLQAFLAKGILGLFLFLRLVSLVVSLVLILVVTLLVPARVETMAAALPSRWPAALGIGFLTAIASGILCVLFAITVIGIPLTILLSLLVKVLGVIGAAGIMAQFGRKMGSAMGMTNAGSPVLTLVLLGYGLVAVIRFVPILGELFWWVLSILGLGLAMVTKIGTPMTGTSSPPSPPEPAPAGHVS